MELKKQLKKLQAQAEKKIEQYEDRGARHLAEFHRGRLSLVKELLDQDQVNLNDYKRGY